ncbi:diguanylate cyclase (GGDEF) domain-containing protein [Pseudonocardia ammonioxydans]|uniref:Diguanylate cyclase (GGDEF) domain-containing protein n=1 Tax=Pseudonocardia ammonioxydans TaxID=260086 RepID=A0A1I4YVG5_PSUAM|nr:GGDEF domain-containing protein [Pseudonocardia ammonioxydans]SFN42018.1 diguanylate cyclase (GGDEF) domain-containing protein [Pseudonocardia ammonioxydans]
MTDTAWTVCDPARRTSTQPATAGIDDVGPADPAARAALHTAAAERLAGDGCFEQAYQHLREAVRLLSDPTGAPVEDELDRLRREHAEAREQSRRDSLTSTYNRRYLDERLTDLIDSGTVRPVCLALADIDHFKQVNDTHGHPFGDRVLQRMVHELGRGLPRGAFCARYGGEEFALVLPGLGPEDGVAVCEAARERVAAHDWTELHPRLRMTISIGVAHIGPGDGEVEPLVDEADLLLYAAKQAGRNAVAHRSPDGRVLLAGAASGRRSIPQLGAGPGRPGPPPPVTAE